MTRNPETRFIARINRLLPLKRRAESSRARAKYPFAIHCEKMANPWTSGTADCWYSGKRDIWVEYKCLGKLPQRADIHPEKLLRPLQTAWLTERATEGRRVCIIIGCPDGCVWLEANEIGTPIPVDVFRRRALTIETAAERLLREIQS
ncbi:MAG: hypothetical protein LBU11_12475 [Zoogloeaceae bacterium]|jgi:hypothetical protein|nr:hypothetical protein [Zoogloeaceae bacterium]